MAETTTAFKEKPTAARPVRQGKTTKHLPQQMVLPHDDTWTGLLYSVPLRPDGGNLDCISELQLDEGHLGKSLGRLR